MRQSNKPILLVDDDDVDVLAVQRALKQLGVPNPVTVAGNGEAALEILLDARTPRPVLIFLDLNMPRMGGLELLRRVRAEGCAEGIPIVVLTTSRQDRDVVEGFQNHVAGYMIKPVAYDELVEVMKAIDRYWTLSELPA